jgi:hypothetical protein
VRLVDRHAMSGGTAVGIGASPRRRVRVVSAGHAKEPTCRRARARSLRSLILMPLVVETSWLSGNLRSRQIYRRMGIQYAYCRNILPTR